MGCKESNQTKQQQQQKQYSCALCTSQQCFSQVVMVSCVVYISRKYSIRSLVQGHNTVPPVSLELATLRLQVIYSSTEATTHPHL